MAKEHNIIGDSIINDVLEGLRGEGGNVPIQIFLVRRLMILITISFRYSENSLVTS